MLEFEKGYLCFWDVNRPIIWKCEGEGNHDGVVKYKWGSADYIKVSKEALQEWNELGKWKSLGGHWLPVEEFLDHHYMLCSEDDCAFGDTPKEALRKYLLLLRNQKDEDYVEKDYYVRKDNRFYYLNDFIDNEDEWNNILSDIKVIYVWTIGMYNGHRPEMIEIDIEE